MTYKELFTDQRDRARVLGEILRRYPVAPVRPGTTLIAHLDRATQAVLGVRSIRTPTPVLDANDCFQEAQFLRLSEELRAVAQDLVPRQIWDRRRKGPPKSELITVVCREGEPVITPTELIYHWGWRYSNHFADAFNGEVFVLTPQGWAELYTKWTSTQPALLVLPDSPDAILQIQDAERLLAELASGLLDPRPGECLLCYVHRMLLDYNCNGQLRFALHYRDQRAPRATALPRRLGQSGGYCDCEIFLNGYDLRPEHQVPIDEAEDDWDEPDLTWPDPLPACAQVRTGSTQPCGLWWRRGRW